MVRELLPPSTIREHLQFEFMPPGSRFALLPFSQVSPIALAGDMSKWLGDDDVRRFLRATTPRFENPNNPATIDAVQERYVKDQKKAYFLILDMDNPTTEGNIIGFASLQDINWAERTFERGIVIGDKGMWNQGVARQVGELILTWTQLLGFKKAKAQTHKDNLASARNLANQFGQYEEEGEYLCFELDLYKWPPLDYFGEAENSVHAPEYLFRPFIERYNAAYPPVATIRL